MPKAPWRRRGTTDNPRPAGRRWTGRLRRSGTLARQVLLVRVGRRHRESLGAPPIVRQARGEHDASAVRVGLAPEPDQETDTVAPFSPAVVPSHVDTESVRSIPLLPGERTAVRRAKFLLVNACTLTSLSIGLLAIFLAMHGQVRTAAVCLIVCVVCDGLDGPLARKLGVASPFGAQMDSLADMCSFGLAAPVVVYASLAGTVPPAAAVVACTLVAGGAAIRLARFNVSPKDGRFFCGVPTTWVAAVLALNILIGPGLPGDLMAALSLVCALAMVTSFPYAKLASVVRLPRLLLLLLLLLHLAGIAINLSLTFSLVVVVYLISGPLLWLRFRRRPATQLA